MWRYTRAATGRGDHLLACRMLGVAAPLATAELKKLGLVEHEPYRGAILTPEGENAAPSTRSNKAGSGILLELG